MNQILYKYNVNDYINFYDNSHIVFFEIQNNKIKYLYGLLGYNENDKTIKEITYSEIIKGQKYKLEIQNINISNFNEEKYVGKYYIKVYGGDVCFQRYYKYSDYLKFLVISNKINILSSGEAIYNNKYNNPTIEDIKKLETMENRFYIECINAYYNYIFDECFDRFLKDNRFWEYIKVKFKNKLTYETLNKIPYWPAHFTDDECENSLSKIKNEYDEINKENNKSFLEKYKKLIIGTIIGIIIKSFFDNINEIWNLIINII